MNLTLIRAPFASLVAALFCLAQPSPVIAAPGGADLTFDSDGAGPLPGGRVLTPIGVSHDYALGVAVQADGKIVAAGHAFNGSNYDFALTRYTKSGVLDPTFGVGGKVISPIGSFNDHAWSMALQSDGKIVLAGYAHTATGIDFAVARYTADGALDPAFGSGGKVISDIGTVEDTAYCMAIQSDGKIVVAGSTREAGNTTSYKVSLARYTSGGVLDPTFGSGGKVITSIGQGHSIAQGIVLQDDGKIVIAVKGIGQFGFDFALARFTSAGVLDSTFGNEGTVFTPIGTSDDVAQSLALQTDGKIVLAGQSFGPSYDISLARYTSDGVLDPTFGNGGKVTSILTNFEDHAKSVLVQNNGKIVVAGYAYSASSDFILARYTADGILDATFGNGGKVVSPITSDDRVMGAALQIDGKIVVAGYARNGGNDDFLVARFEGDPVLVANFTATPNPAAPNQAITFDATGSLPPVGISFEWDFGDGSAPATGAIVQHVYPQFGTYTATLTITDHGAPASTARETATIHVNQGNLAPVADIVAPAFVGLMGSATLNGAGSSDPNAAAGDAIVSFAWDLDNDGQFDDATGASVTFDPVVIGMVPNGETVFRLRVADSFGATGVASATMIYDTIPPETTIISGPIGITGTSVVFKVASSEPGVFRYSLDGGPEQTTEQDTIVLTGLATGDHTFSVAAWDRASNQDATPVIASWTVDLNPRVTVLFSKGGAVPGAGEEGSGIPAGAQWRTFGVPSINRSGTTAFLAASRSPIGSASAIFKGELVGLEPAMVARSKQAAFGAPAGVLYYNFKDPLLNERGDVAFVANLSGTGVSAANNQALFVISADNDSDTLVAREGAEPAGVAGAEWKAFTSVAFANESQAGGAWTLAFTATMRTGLQGAAGPGGVTRASDTGLWLAEAQRVVLALREGQSLNVDGTDRIVKSFQALSLPPGAAGHGFGVSTAGLPARVNFLDGTQAIARVSLGNADGDGVEITALAMQGDSVPGLDVKLKKFGLSTQNESGELSAWVSSLDAQVNASAVVSADRHGGLSMVVRKGDSLSTAPGAPVFSSFTSAVVNDEEQYAILGKLAGTSVTKADDGVLTRRLAATGWEIVAREGAQPPGTPAGAQWAAFPSCALADAGGTVAFLGRLKVPRTGEANPAGISNRNDTGLWIALPGEPVQLLLREGDRLGEKTIRNFAALTTVSGSASQRRAFNADGSDLVVRVIATDGTQHVLHIALPAVKLP